ncbi:tryptophan synthase subunit alpha [Streptomyces sp. WG-D5]
MSLHDVMLCGREKRTHPSSELPWSLRRVRRGSHRIRRPPGHDLRAGQRHDLRHRHRRVTGGQGPLHHRLEDCVARLRKVTDLPVGVGIGVSTPQQAAAIGKIADTCIVGSALVRALDSQPG